jgi:hypothetical protein
MSNDVVLLQEVTKMLEEFRRHFSYMQGKSIEPDLKMPTAALTVWVKIYEDLTPEERKVATLAVYEKHKFHPTPNEFKEAVRGSDDGEALENWIEILAMVRLNPQDACKRLYLLTPTGQRALTVVGGLRALGEANESTLHSSIRVSYCAAYKSLKLKQSHQLTDHEPRPIEREEEPIQEIDPQLVKDAIAQLTAQMSR